MIISEEQAKAIMAAFDRLHTEDFLSCDQWRCAISIMDCFPFLNEQYFYLRDRYGVKSSHESASDELSITRDDPEDFM